MKNGLYVLLLLAVQICGAAELEIALSEPRWTLEPIGPPLSQREALLQPSALAIALSPLVRDGKYQEAVELIEERVPADEERRVNTLDPALLLWIGQIYLTVEDYEQAGAYLRGALTRLPDFIRAHQALGLVYLLQDRFDEAHEHVARAVALGGANAQLLGYLGYLNREANNHWGAISAYQQALMLERENPEWQRGLLYSLIGARQYESARAFVEQLLGRFPDEIELWLYRAQAALRSQDYETALASLEVAIQLGESNRDNLHVGALLHLEIGSTSRGIDLLRGSFAEGLEYTYVDQSLTWLIGEERWSFAGELIDAVERQDRQLNDVERSLLLSRKASVAAASERTAEAIDLLEQAVTLDPANSDALIGLADIYAGERQFVRAELLYERASVFDSVRERALLNHARMAVERTDYATALRLLLEVNRTSPDRYDLRENIQILENLLGASQR